MPVDDRELRLRRIKRHVKAGASIVLAVAAGAFLACQRNISRVNDRSPMGPDARSGPPRPPPPAVDASAPPAQDAALAVRDASVAADRPHRVDVDEHRRGLPVIDNLLE